MISRSFLLEKLWESVRSVLPIAGIVAAVCFLLVPVTPDLMLSFLIGTTLLILGMSLFSVGSEKSMTLIGTYIGSRMTRSRKLWLILSVSFLQNRTCKYWPTMYPIFRPVYCSSL